MVYLTTMITSLITLALFALFLWVIYFLIGKFVTGTPLSIIGLILGLVFLLKALPMLGVSL